MAFQSFSVTMTSGSTLTGELDLGTFYRRVFLDITGAASEVRIQIAEKSGGTYRQLNFPNVTSSSAGILKVASALSGGYTEIYAGCRFMKIETTAAVSNGLVFKVIGNDNGY